MPYDIIGRLFINQFDQGVMRMKVVMKLSSIICFYFVVVLLAACGAQVSEPVVIQESSVKELKIIDHVIGDGTKTRNSQRVAVHYTGWLYDENATDFKGEKFDSSYDRKRPFVFSLGNKAVIDGWEKGLLGMKAGGKRTLIIPPHMGYGSRGAGSSIPPNAALVFDIELLKAG